MSDMGDLGDVDINLVQQKASISVPLPKGNVAVSDVQATTRGSIGQMLNMETSLTALSIPPDSPEGAVLYKSEICPENLKADLMPRLKYVSRMFKFWQGDIDFKFVFTKTILMQMKMIAVFVPGARFDDAPPTPQSAMFYHHKVIINPANEAHASLRVPFISTTPYRFMDSPTGVLYVLVFQPITVSSGDANMIHVNMFVSGRDLEFHELIPPPMTQEPDVAPDPLDLGHIYFFLGLEYIDALTYLGVGVQIVFSPETGPAEVVNTLRYSCTDFYADVVIGTAFSAQGNEIFESVAFDPATHAVIHGAPQPGDLSYMTRVIWFTSDDVAEHATVVPCFAAKVYVARNVMWYHPTIATAPLAIGYPALAVAQFDPLPSLSPIFRVADPRIADQSSKIEDLEKQLSALIRLLSARDGQRSMGSSENLYVAHGDTVDMDVFSD